MNIKPFLVASKICDDDGRLSHTSLLLSVAIARLAFFPADAYTVAILTLALTHANAKRFKAYKATQHTDAVAGLNEKQQAELMKIKADIKQLETSNSLSKLR